MAYIINNPDGQ